MRLKLFLDVISSKLFFKKKGVMGPRWKGTGSKTKAAAEPMSEIVSSLQLSLTTSNCKGLLLGCSVHLQANSEQSTLLNRACFGRQKAEQQYELSLEEAFYLCHSLKCLQITGHDSLMKSDVELWYYMCSKVESFPELYKAYSHLRLKNWVVRSGSQYGVDYVAYRHHPALVHSEYAVLVLSDKKHYPAERLKSWSDLHCTIRLCGGVAKTLLVLHVQAKGNDIKSLNCLKDYEVKERTITRWIPEQNRERRSVVEFPSD